MLSHFMTRGRSGNDGAKANLKKIRGSVKKLIVAALPGANYKTVVLEDLFSAYELQASHLRSTPDEVTEAGLAIRTLSEALFISVQEMGRGDAAKWLPHQRNETASPYAELLELLFPQGARDDQMQKHVLVTMNYDINIDRCALNMVAPVAGKIDLDYGFELADYRFSAGFRRPGNRAILLLRLHGSVNWLRCLACQAVFTTVTNQATIKERKDCPCCESHSLDRILVHPSYLRSYEDPILQLTWGRFQEELVSADRWIFVGYSLPDADIHLRDSLRHAMRTRGRRPTSVVWVGCRNPNWKAERRRYKMMFGDKLVSWNATAGGFAEFLRCLDP